MVREFTMKIVDALEQGMLTADNVAEMCLAYMSEDDVKDMCRANDLFTEDDEEGDSGDCMGDDWEE